MRLKYSSSEMRKYSCSGPTVVVTFLHSMPNSFNILLACMSSAFMDFNTGDFLSSVSPV